MLRLFAVGCVIAVAGCSGQSVEHTDAAAIGMKDGGLGDGSSRRTDAAPLPACTWDTSLFRAAGHVDAHADAQTDASANLCFAARTNTVCTGVKGCTVECLVDDPSQCPGPSTNGSCSSSGDAGRMACVDTCKPGEFAVECQASGQGGQGPFGVPPSGCRGDPGVISAEAEFYCCPCGT